MIKRPIAALSVIFVSLGISGIIVGVWIRMVTFPTSNVGGGLTIYPAINRLSSPLPEGQEVSVQFQRVEEQGFVEHSVVIRNRSLSDIHIIAATSSCSCIDPGPAPFTVGGENVVSFPVRIAKNASAKLQITYHLKDKSQFLPPIPSTAR